MGFLTKLMGGPAAVSSKPGMLLIDGNTLNSNSGNRINLSPTDQIQTLRRLARFVEKEKVAMSVVFDSQPLRKIEHGKKFETITVYFSEGSKKVADMFNKLQRDNSGRHDVVVVTNNKDLEGLIRNQGGKTMRSTTFKKAIESGGGGRDGGRDGGNRNRGNRRRRPPRGEGAGNREGGNREGGNREGGNREGGKREGGNREGGNREGGNREGGNREGGNRNRGPRKPAPRKEGVEGLIDLVD